MAQVPQELDRQLNSGVAAVAAGETVGGVGGASSDGPLHTVSRSTVVELSEGVEADEDLETAAAAERLRTGRWIYRVVKHAFDVLFSLVILVLLSWLFAAVAIAIKLGDPNGPVIFRQTRVGRGGREFTMYKFRSMVSDAESRLSELAALNEKTGPVFKMREDPRVTRVGHFIRKLSLAPVIIGTPGDGEPTKSLSHPENSSLDLQKCERRPGTSLGAHHHYTSFQFLSFAVFGGPEGTSGRHLCAFARAPFAAVGTVA